MKTSNTYNETAEISVLASMFFERECLDEGCGRLKADDFYFTNNRNLFMTLYQINLDDLEVSIPQILDVSKKFIGKTIPDETIDHLMDFTTDRKSFDKFVLDIVDRSYVRKFYRSIRDMENMIASEDTVDPDKIRNTFNALLDKYEDGNVKSHTSFTEAVQGNYYGRSVLDQARHNLDLSRQGINPLMENSILTGYSELDDVIHGMGKNRLIVFGGRPAMGKTTFCLNVIRNLLFSVKANSMFVSLEMSCDDVALKLSLIEAGVDYNKYIKGIVTPEDLDKIDRAQKRFANNENGELIIESPSKKPSVNNIRYLIKKHMKTNDIKVVFIDNLTLLHSSNSKHDIYTRVSEITRDLKLLTEELGIPIVLICQLSRESAKREHKTPTLTDLRDSGSIEQDADQVLFIHRPDYFENPTSDTGRAYIHIAKNRWGRVGKVAFSFLAREQKFKVFNPSDYEDFEDGVQ